MSKWCFESRHFNMIMAHCIYDIQSHSWSISVSCRFKSRFPCLLSTPSLIDDYTSKIPMSYILYSNNYNNCNNLNETKIIFLYAQHFQNLLQFSEILWQCVCGVFFFYWVNKKCLKYDIFTKTLIVKSVTSCLKGNKKLIYSINNE